MTELRTHTLPVKGMTCSGCEEKVKNAISELQGVAEVGADAAKSTVRVSYDLEKTSLTDIEERIRQSGFSLKAGLWQRVKLGWARFAERNERDNLEGGGASCCSAPKLSGKSHGGHA